MRRANIRRQQLAAVVAQRAAPALPSLFVCVCVCTFSLHAQSLAVADHAVSRFALLLCRLLPTLTTSHRAYLAVSCIRGGKIRLAADACESGLKALAKGISIGAPDTPEWRETLRCHLLETLFNAARADTMSAGVAAMADGAARSLFMPSINKLRAEGDLSFEFSFLKHPQVCTPHPHPPDISHCLCSRETQRGLIKSAALMLLGCFRRRAAGFRSSLHHSLTVAL